MSPLSPATLPGQDHPGTRPSPARGLLSLPSLTRGSRGEVRGESTFATVRHRTIRSKGCLSNKTALAMVFKLIEGAQKNWRRIDGHNQLPKLIQGVRFTDGIEVIGSSAAPQAQVAA